MMRVRSGTAADIAPAVSVFQAADTALHGGRQLLAPVGEQRARVRDCMASASGVFVVAEDAGVVIGMAIGVQGRAEGGTGPALPGLCHLSMVAVAPDRWGHGIGRRLLDALLAGARSRGYTRAQLWTQGYNVRARRLYAGHGFQLTGQEQEHEQENELIVQYHRTL